MLPQSSQADPGDLIEPAGDAGGHREAGNSREPRSDKDYASIEVHVVTINGLREHQDHGARNSCFASYSDMFAHYQRLAQQGGGPAGPQPAGAVPPRRY